MADLQVVTTARSVNGLRHFKELQRSTKSIAVPTIESEMKR